MLYGGVNIWRRALCSEHVSDYFFPGERGKRQRSNKLLRGAGHNDLYPDAAILQQADNFRRLVGCNSAADAQGNLHERFLSPEIGNLEIIPCSVPCLIAHWRFRLAAG